MTAVTLPAPGARADDRVAVLPVPDAPRGEHIGRRPMRGHVAVVGMAVAVLLTVAGARPAGSGVIGGTLWMTRAARAAAAHPTRLPRAQRGAVEAVVYVDAVPAAVERKLSGRRRWWFGRSQPAPPLHLVQVDRQFKPRVAAIAAGTLVEFRNLDRVYHGAFSVSPAKRFDLGKYPPGKVDTLRFDRPGVVNLHCEIHPSMVGYLVVTPNHAFVRPDSLGRFVLPRLPPGTYTVRAMHPTRGEARQHVTVPKRGDVAIEMELR